MVHPVSVVRGIFERLVDDYRGGERGPGDERVGRAEPLDICQHCGLDGGVDADVAPAAKVIIRMKVAFYAVEPEVEPYLIGTFSITHCNAARSPSGTGRKSSLTPPAA
jgi:hypothetical protein